MNENIIDALFEPACIIDNSLKIKLINASWLQFISKPIDSLNDAIASKDTVAITDDILVLENKIRPFIEGQAHFFSIDKAIDYRICNYNSAFLLVLNLPFSESTEMLYDTLTGLPTRAILLDRISKAMADCRRNSSKMLVYFIDLDNFKPINDQHGHETGDMVLVESVRQLQSVIREQDTLARYGGDEFVAVCPFYEEAIHGALTAKRMLRNLSKKMTLNSLTLQIGASIGIGIYPDDAEDPAGLIKAADKAMYMAKESGKNVYCFYSKQYRY